MKKLIFAVFLLFIFSFSSLGLIYQENGKVDIQELKSLEITQKTTQTQDSEKADFSEETRSRPKKVIESSLSPNHKTKSKSKLVSNNDKSSDFSPSMDIDFSNHYHYQSTSMGFTLTQDETEKEIKMMSSFFDKGYFDIDRFEADDLIGFGHIEMLNGTITYEITIADKFPNFYNLHYEVVDSSNPFYSTGTEGPYGMIAKTGDNMNFSSFKLFEEEDNNNITDTIDHFISLTDGVFRNPEPGMIQVEKTFMSMDYEIYTETQKIEITEFTPSYCSLMHGMFEVAHNSELGDDNYDGRLDVYEDDTINIQDLAVFAAHYEDEFCCAYQLTQL